MEYDQRMIIKFLLNEGADARDIVDRLQTQFGEHPYKLRAVRFWIPDVRLGCASSPVWQLGPVNFGYFAAFLIPTIHYNTSILGLLHFSHKGARYSHNDAMSGI
jgi:hypothetical protein